MMHTSPRAVPSSAPRRSCPPSRPAATRSITAPISSASAWFSTAFLLAGSRSPAHPRTVTKPTTAGPKRLLAAAAVGALVGLMVLAGYFLLRPRDTEKKPAEPEVADKPSVTTDKDHKDLVPPPPSRKRKRSPAR